MLLRLLRGLTVCLAPAGTRSRVAPAQPEGGSARPKAACREHLQSGGHCSRVPPWRELLNRTPSWVTVKSTAPRGLSCDGSRCVETQGGCCLEHAQGRAGQQPRSSFRQAVSWLVLCSCPSIRYAQSKLFLWCPGRLASWFNLHTTPLPFPHLVGCLF